jgi:hypothetical protein
MAGTQVRWRVVFDPIEIGVKRREDAASSRVGQVASGRGWRIRSGGCHIATAIAQR